MSTDSDFGSLQTRLASVENRIGNIEKRLGLRPASPATTTTDSTSRAPLVTNLPPLSPVREKDESGNWLGAIAVVCFVLAAGFIIKLSIESGWLTPERQLGLATLFGFSLIGLGFWFSKSDREYASFLPAAGVIVLYLTAFGAHRFYSILSLQGALIAISAVSALCIWLYTELEHDLYAVTAAVGSYLSPLLLNLNPANVFSAYYFLLCSIAFATISVWVRSRTLAVVAAYLAIGTTAVIGFALGQPELVASLLAFHFIVFTIGTVLQTKYTGIELTETGAFAYFPVLVLFYATEYHFISKLNPGLAPWCSLVFAGVLIAFYLIAKRWFPGKTLGSRSVIFAFATLVAFHSGYLELLPKAAHPWLLSVIMLVLAFLPVNTDSKDGATSRALLIPKFAIMAILGIEYVSLVFQLFDKPPQDTFEVAVLAAFTALISIWIFIARATALGTSVFGGNWILLMAAHLLAILGVYNVAYSAGSLAVSAGWLIYAVAVMAFAFRLRDEVMAKSALAVLGLAAAKALIYDASSAPTLVRIVCLLLTGAILYGAGFLMRQISSWKK